MIGQAPAAAPAVEELAVAPELWSEAIAAEAAAGWRFAGLHAIGGDDAPGLRAVLRRGAGHRLLTCRSAARRAPSLLEVIPAAAWDEREAHDLHGWAFDGHEPLRPLADHAVPMTAWAPVVEGRDAHQVAVGPIHAGIIESGHFRFHVVGERILHVDVRLFHKHRGLEAAAEGLRYSEAVAYAQRACAADAVANTVAYAQACETALGLWPHDDVRRARTLLLELERLYNHLNDISAICAGVGFAAGTMLFAALKERAQRINERLTGHRFLFGTVAVGRSHLQVDAATARGLRSELGVLAGDVERGWRELQFAGSLQERLDGVGAVEATTVRRLGGAGVAARAAGIGQDARDDAPALWYDGFAPVVADPATGDVAARFQVRGEELVTTLALLRDLLAAPVAPAGSEPHSATAAVGAATVEGPRGPGLCTVELDGDRVARLSLRTASYANWPLVALAARDELLPDFPLVNKSFELCYACVDR